MIKNVAVNEIFTTGNANLELADGVLGRISEPQTRWSPGSLAAAIMATATVPLLIVATGHTVRAYTVDSDAHAESALVTLSGGGHYDQFVFHPVEGQTTKSRAFVVKDSGGEPIVVDIGAVFDGSALPEGPMTEMVLPSAPTYSASSLVNKWETASLAAADHNYWLAMLCQRTGKAMVIRFDTLANLNSFITAIEAKTGVSKLIGYTLTENTPAGEEPVNFIWE